MNFLTSIATKFGIGAAKAGANYAAAAISGNAGVRVLDAQVNFYSTEGEKFAGSFGSQIGTLIGKSVAGHSLPLVKGQVTSLSHELGGALCSGIDISVDAMSKTPDINLSGQDVKIEPLKNGSQLASKAFNVARIGTGLVGLAAIPVAVSMGAVPLAAAGVLSAGVNAAPRILESIYSTPQQETHLVDVLVDASKSLVIDSAGVLAGNIARYNQVKAAYHLRPLQGEQAGNLVGSYLPTNMQKIAGQVGRYFGEIDAGRYAMSDENLQIANEVGNATEKFVKTGLVLTDAVVSSQMKKPSSSMLETGGKVLWIGAGVLSGAALIAVAPEVAPFAGAMALISVSDRMISFAKGFPKPVVQETSKEDTEEKDLIGNQEGEQNDRLEAHLGDELDGSPFEVGDGFVMVGPFID